MFRVFMIMLAFSGLATAETMTAEKIIERSMQNATGVDDLTHELKMQLVDEKGNELEREMTIKVLRESEEEAYSLLIFTAPRREKGIALLTESAKSEDDKQYLYIPSRGRLQRVNSSNRGSSFRGSEFTFEDLSTQKPSDYKYELKGEEKCGEWQCYVLIRTPLAAESSYSKTLSWIDKQHFRLVKADFYDQEGKLLKVMSAEDFSLVEGKYWNPKRITMANQQDGKKTVMVSESLKINSGLKSSEFTELAIRKWR